METAKQLKTLSPKSVPSNDSGIVEPIACLTAMDSLRSLPPDSVSTPGDTESLHGLLPNRRDALRKFRRAFLTGLPLLCADLLAMCLLLSISRAVVALTNSSHFGPNFETLAWFCGTYVVIGLAMGLYPGTGINAVVILRIQTLTIVATTAVVMIASIVAGTFTVSSAAASILGCLACAIGLPVLRSLVRDCCVRFDWWGERAIIAGTTRNDLEIFEYLLHNEHLGLRPMGVVDEHPAEYWVADTSHEIRFLGTTHNLPSICRQNECYWVIATTAGRDADEMKRFLSVASLVPHLIIADDTVPVANLWGTSFDVAGIAGIHTQERLLQPFARLTKRIFDVALASFLLAVISPLWLLICFVVTSTSRGPILFTHERIGRGGRKFRALKFRTMMNNSERVLQRHLQSNSAARKEWERDQKLRKDPRIIPGVGNFLRRWSLDELPQLWNVVRGDMSLVGPRPIVESEFEKYDDAFHLYARVRPGLTGLWQVSGRNNTTYSARVKLDVYYVRNWSLWLDYYILLRTVRTVLTRQGSC